MDPKSAKAHNDRAMALAFLDRWDAALISFERALAVAPAIATYAANVGAALNEVDRYDDALVILDRALELDERSADTHFSRGRTLDFLGRQGEAAKAYERAVEIHPASNARFALASSLARSGANEDARAAYERSLELEARGVSGHYHRARAHAMLGATDRALPDLRRAVELAAVFKGFAGTEPDFERLRDNPEFKKIVGTD